MTKSTVPALLGLLLACPAAHHAQCGTSFQAFDQSIAPGFEPHALGLAPWDPDGSGPGSELTLIVGAFFDVDGAFVDNLLVHDPATDTLEPALPWGFAQEVGCVATRSDGRVAVSVGTNVSLGLGGGPYAVREWAGAGWNELLFLSGGPLGGESIGPLIYLQNGDLVIGGGFRELPGVAASRVARFDGSSWHPLGSGLTGEVRRLRFDRAGRLVACTRFPDPGSVDASGAAVWDGASWSPAFVGAAGISTELSDLAFLADGRVAGAGVFEFPDAGVTSCAAIWDGADWTLPAGGIPLDPFGQRTTFSALELPGGDVLFGGTFTSAGGAPAGGLARYDGAGWSDPTGSFSTATRDLHLDAAGDVWCGGQVLLSGGVFGGFGRLRADCAASAEGYGDGGTGSAGPLSIEAVGLPWLGATFGAEIEGLASGAFAFALVGFQPDATPLALWNPAATADSTLWVVPSPALVTALPVSGPTATWSVALPPTPELAGAAVYLQGLAVEPGAPGGLLIATSDALDLTLGLF